MIAGIRVAFGVIRRYDRPVMIAAILMFGVIATAQQVWIRGRPEPAHVLNYPQQRVLSTLPGIPGAAVRLGHDLTVRGTKCNTSPHPVPVTGVVSWVSLDPPGSVIRTEQGHAVRAPGCVTREYRNPIPALVAARTRQIAADAGPACTVWQITGREVPDDPQQLPQTWVSLPVQVCT